MAQRHIFSTLDSIFPPVVHNWILGFPCENSNRKYVLNVLRQGLKRTMLQRPYLAGHLSISNGKLHIDNPAVAQVPVPIHVKEFPQGQSNVIPYADLKTMGMPMSYLVAERLEPPGGYEGMKHMPVAAQVNFIPGGCLFSVMLNHAFMDGIVNPNVLRDWARNCKEVQEQGRVQDDPATFADIPGNNGRDSPYIPRLTKALRDIEESPIVEKNRIVHDRLLWERLGLQMPTPRTKSLRGLQLRNKRTSALFVAKNQSLAKLKDSSMPLEGAGPGSFISTADAETALLWKCIMRARLPDLEPGTEISRLRIPTNMRPVLGVSNEHLGNVFQNSRTDISLHTLVAKKDNRDVAWMIRSSTNRTRDTRLAQDALRLSALLPEVAPDYSLRRPVFPDPTIQNQVVSNWRDMRLYENDWGAIFGPSGRIEFLRIPQSYRPGLCALMPRSNKDTAEVMIDLQESQLDRLLQDPEFTGYYRLVFR